MGIIEDALARQAAEAPRRIDYDRMNRILPRQKAELTRAVKAYRAIPDPREIKAGPGFGDRYEAAEAGRAAAAEKIAAVIKRHVAIWNEIGAWPDQWHTWQVALSDVLPWSQHVDIGDL